MGLGDDFSQDDPAGALASGRVAADRFRLGCTTLPCAAVQLAADLERQMWLELRPEQGPL